MICDLKPGFFCQNINYQHLYQEVYLYNFNRYSW